MNLNEPKKTEWPRLEQFLFLLTALSILAVGALGIWVYSLNGEFTNQLMMNRLVSENNGIKLDYHLELLRDYRADNARVLSLANQNHELLSRLMERMEVRIDREQGATKRPGK